ncbi:cyclic nucleotide-binding domain-containing protein [Bdellovibrio reynosensis]|uniref:Cyclic nucleotide-binding domain-containing protein n=1 Tax=Bdellovibrio reynosensis TaxID=2835041 RepID=A0ABY4C8J5_9BACT|nr:cyclic nucleotide-binding domain-containing protein [Bdellovibrio reynosensis]UOF00794.1 cyclic nucleotide-binding domain-containing protein [Bdellovibrio reynosensis]
MGQEKKCNFLIISGDKTRIQKCTDIINRHVPNSSVFCAAEWFEIKYKLANVHPKAILVDEYLPKGSGLDVVSRIIKDKNNSDISLIIMSYIADHEVFANEVNSGQVQFLTEPDREHALIECLNKIISPKKEEKSPQENYEIKQLKPGDILFKEGEKSEEAYIVKNGSLRAFCYDHDGQKIILGEIKAGEFVGEMGHFNHELRSATVEAVSDVELIAIPNSAIDNVIFARPSWAKALVKTLSTRLRKANKALTG